MRFAGFHALLLVASLFSPSSSRRSLRMPPPPSARPPTSDAYAVDQGIACALMLVALLVTYLVH
ncbi:unnamed protein product [Spirodela intermedia]|uniref:Uncharacterized protein n=1 Tax=Spirodela intermedia TaxID=51605 RepID=A0A7I8JT01_SPIIN|nr:unnamed protein product [Spirodela intermedia]CAA6672723.1 unnamed protein product [Spirodela intermedia]